MFCLKSRLISLNMLIYVHKIFLKFFSQTPKPFSQTPIESIPHPITKFSTKIFFLIQTKIILIDWLFFVS